MASAAAELAALVAGELCQPAPEAARSVADAARERHGEAVAAALFYGSCLRRGTHEGVLDFYLLVDDYRSAYRSRPLAWANALLPPNVFYLEVPSPLGTLRAKYAVVSLRDFEGGARGRGLRSSLWARFCQPARLVYARDPDARQRVVDACVTCHLTVVERVLPLLPAPGGAIAFAPGVFWERALRATYAAEWRTEPPATIRGIYRGASERFDRAVRLALEILAERGGLELRSGDAVRLEPDARRRARVAWALSRPLAKAVYLVTLLKSAFTFGDWLPYALWKVERHTGRHIEASERQRRHPLVWGWPLLFRVLWRRDLH